jgi:V8-like Glu-specific endopeptidase
LRSEEKKHVAIFPPDDRTLVQTFGSPWKFVGRWDINAGDGVGSGVLIGDQYVLTAQHVLFDMGPGPDSTFAPAYNKENGVVSTPYGTVERDGSRPSHGFTDIAMVHVNENPTGISKKSQEWFFSLIYPMSLRTMHMRERSIPQVC